MPFTCIDNNELMSMSLIAQAAADTIRDQRAQISDLTDLHKQITSFNVDLANDLCDATVVLKRKDRDIQNLQAALRTDSQVIFDLKSDLQARDESIAARDQRIETMAMFTINLTSAFEDALDDLEIAHQRIASLETALQQSDDIIAAQAQRLNEMALEKNINDGLDEAQAAVLELLETDSVKIIFNLDNEIALKA